MPAPRAVAASLCWILFLGVFLGSCSRSRHTYDPHLRKIDVMLNQQLPGGTPRARVQYFLQSRGYQLEGAADKTVIRALIRHVDADTLQPAAAHATFHFDSNDKLTSYELEPAAASPF